MALTIATGFVVDDAIVMIENIARYMEKGETPLEAALKGSKRDRLHHHLADLLADRGADPAAVHGRRGRAAVPRVRHHAGGGHPDLRLGVADPDADDVRQAAAPRRAGAGRALRPRGRALHRQDDRALCRRPARGAAAPAADAAGGHRHAGAHRAAVHVHAQGLLPGAGHRGDPGHRRGAAVDLLPGHGRAPAGPGRDRAEGSGGGEPDLLHRRRRHQPHAQQRPPADQPQAARRARRHRHRGDPPPAAGTGPDRPASSCTCSRCRI